MTEKIRRVDRDGPPDPEQWVCWRISPGRWTGPVEGKNAPDVSGRCEWFPTDPPPTEYVEDEGVEVDGERYRKRFAAWVQRREGVHWLDYATIAEIRRVARVAAAFGLVDQPTVPKKLVDEMQRWVDDPFCGPNVRYAVTNLLDRVRGGEFGPVEWEWVTDRLPRDDEYPVLRCERSTYDVVYLDSDYPVEYGEAWVSLSSLLGDR